jgi:DNA ligase-associated metallophosphoesterase
VPAPEDLTTDLRGEPVILMPERALSRPSTRTLFVADLHIGKPATFAAAGIPVPRGTGERDLARLAECLARAGSRRLVILGDLLHARRGCVDEALAAVQAWRDTPEARDLDIILVRGNHDRSAGDPPASWRFRTFDAGTLLDGWVLGHEPFTDPRGPVLCGHIHPGIHLAGFGGVRERAAAFVVGQHRIILPAFGSFTGTAQPTLEPDDRVFLIDPSRHRVAHVPTLVLTRPTSSPRPARPPRPR